MAVDHVQRGTPFGTAVGPGQVALDDQAAAVLHQRMPDEAQHRAGSGRLIVEPGVRVGGRRMGGVRALFAPEIDLDVAVLAGVAEHRG